MQSAPMRPVMAQPVVVQPPMGGYRQAPLQMQQPQPYFTVPQLSPHPQQHAQQPVVYAPSVPPPQQRFPAPVHYQQPQSYAAVVANPAHQIIYVQHQPSAVSQPVGIMSNGSTMQQPMQPMQPMQTSLTTYGTQLASSAPSYHPYHHHPQQQPQQPQQQPPTVSYMMSTAPISSYAQPMVSTFYQTQQPPTMYTTIPAAQPVVVSARPPMQMTPQYRAPPPNVMPSVGQQPFLPPPDPHQSLPNGVNGTNAANLTKPPPTTHSKVLEIVNPKTNEVINKQDVDRSRHTSGGETRGASQIGGRVGERRRLIPEGRRSFREPRTYESLKQNKQRIGPLPFQIVSRDPDAMKQTSTLSRRTSESSDASHNARSTPEDAEVIAATVTVTTTTTTSTTDASDQEERSVSVTESASGSSSVSNTCDDKAESEGRAPSSQSTTHNMNDCSISGVLQEQVRFFCFVLKI